MEKIKAQEQAQERILFDKFNTHKNRVKHLALHFERYVYAMHHIYDKVVADAACGTCYGSWLLSLGAKKVIMIDYHQEALDYSKLFNYVSEAEFLLIDIEKNKLPKADIYVSFETIEHLNDPIKFLDKIPTRHLIYSIPINIKSIFHKTDFDSYKDVKELMSNSGWTIKENFEQILDERKSFYYGKAVR